ncbi:hypothetical protein T08_4985 [Trichinella sp. T8]|nr:hypothetical protein T08_4985 [Trichinella sp. T8]
MRRRVLAKTMFLLWRIFVSLRPSVDRSTAFQLEN